jgi:hypothetical protein
MDGLEPEKKTRAWLVCGANATARMKKNILTRISLIYSNLQGIINDKDMLF